MAKMKMKKRNEMAAISGNMAQNIMKMKKDRKSSKAGENEKAKEERKWRKSNEMAKAYESENHRKRKWRPKKRNYRSEIFEIEDKLKYVN